jgi:hypothetical protein
MESDAIYFGRRATEEREAAMRAPHPTARQVHLDMADRYDEISGAITAREVELMPNRVGAG